MPTAMCVMPVVGSRTMGEQVGAGPKHRVVRFADREKPSVGSCLIPIARCARIARPSGTVPPERRIAVAAHAEKSGFVGNRSAPLEPLSSSRSGSTPEMKSLDPWISRERQGRNIAADAGGLETFHAFIDRDRDDECAHHRRFPRPVHRRYTDSGVHMDVDARRLGLQP